MSQIAKGWRGLFQIGASSVGEVRGVDVTVDNNVDPVFLFGNRGADQLVEGHQTVTGSIERAWIDDTLMAYAVNSGGVTSASQLPNFNMTLYPAGVGTSGYPYLVVTGAKATTGTIGTPQDDFAMADIDFSAKLATHYNPVA